MKVLCGTPPQLSTTAKCNYEDKFSPIVHSMSLKETVDPSRPGTKERIEFIGLLSRILNHPLQNAASCEGDLLY